MTKADILAALDSPSHLEILSRINPVRHAFKQAFSQPIPFSPPHKSAALQKESLISSVAQEAKASYEDVALKWSPLSFARKQIYARPPDNPHGKLLRTKVIQVGLHQIQ